jgi:methylmalonyl-CoA mutase N-terminal domain/subunit
VLRHRGPRHTASRGAGSDAFTTISGRPIARVYTAADVAGIDPARDIPDPGVFPYTRGIHPGGYTTRLWTMRQFAGFGGPADTNRRYRALLDAGATGLSVAFDLPTLMGRDPDDPLSAGEVGRCGVSVATAEDMAALFEGIDLGQVTTSMTINAPAAMVFAMYLVAAERQGADWRTLAGTLQNDILKEYIAQKEYIFPPRPSMRLVTDLFAFAGAHVPRWNTISVSGYHIREAGATALQELAFTLADGFEYVQAGIDAGLAPEAFVPRMSFFFNAHSDFFEEIAKYRAARRLWARGLGERFGLTDARCTRLRFHAQTAGVSLTAQQPENNVVRTALEALAAVLGGANSLHTNALDEALGLPTADTATLALRTQQILAWETGLAGTVDPFGGSWFLERLTSDLEAEAREVFGVIDGHRGMIAAIEAGYPQRAIADTASRAQQEIERGTRRVVGVNAFADDEPTPTPALAIDPAVEPVRCREVARRRAARDGDRAARALDALAAAAGGRDNVMPPLIECARASVTVGEMCGVLRGVWGEYVESPSI